MHSLKLDIVHVSIYHYRYLDLALPKRHIVRLSQTDNITWDGFTSNAMGTMQATVKLTIVEDGYKAIGISDEQRKVSASACIKVFITRDAQRHQWLTYSFPMIAVLKQHCKAFNLS